MKKTRLITAAVMLVILIPLITIPSLLGVFELFMLAFTIVASLELIQMFEKKTNVSPLFKWITIMLTLMIYLSTVGLLGWNQPDPFRVNHDMFVAMLPLMIVFLFIYFVLSKTFTVTHVGHMLLVMIYIGLGVASITIIRLIGIRFVFYMALISSMTDTFAYVFGLTFGKHKLAPLVSPKKTWEGAIGGTVVATIVASVYALFYGTLFPSTTNLGQLFNPSGDQTLLNYFFGDVISFGWQVVIIVFLSLVGSIISQFGDLAASKLKRHYEIKDFGKLFPGHGGILDRFDSMIMVSLYLSAMVYIIELFV